MIKGAIISTDGTYRYALWRIWDEIRPALIWIMLNPSTADDQFDDPTIRVCMGRARRMGAGGIHVVNLFAYRATEPATLLKVRDPYGPENMEHVIRSLDCQYMMVIAAWGSGGVMFNAGETMAERLNSIGTELHALGIGKNGQPVHPLYVAYAKPVIRWRPA